MFSKIYESRNIKVLLKNRMDKFDDFIYESRNIKVLLKGLVTVTQIVSTKVEI